MAEYIDRQALRNKLFSLTRVEHNAPWLDTFESMINALPAADVALVKHGRWVDGCCDQCGSDPSILLDAYQDYLDLSDASHCPHCGARMDGGRK